MVHPSVPEYILEGEITDKRAGWITKILEYDVDVKPTNMVKGRVACQHITQNDKP